MVPLVVDTPAGGSNFKALRAVAVDVSRGSVVLPNCIGFLIYPTRAKVLPVT